LGWLKDNLRNCPRTRERKMEIIRNGDRASPARKAKEMRSSSAHARCSGADKASASKRAAVDAPTAPEAKRRKVEVVGFTREERLGDTYCMLSDVFSDLAFKAILEERPIPKESESIAQEPSINEFACLNEIKLSYMLQSSHVDATTDDNTSTASGYVSPNEPSVRKGSAAYDRANHCRLLPLCLPKVALQSTRLHKEQPPVTLAPLKLAPCSCRPSAWSRGWHCCCHPAWFQFEEVKLTQGSTPTQATLDGFVAPLIARMDARATRNVCRAFDGLVPGVADTAHP
ncbi:unnamed protein product, partial [Aureobasidium pullulans]